MPAPGTHIIARTRARVPTRARPHDSILAIAALALLAYHGAPAAQGIHTGLHATDGQVNAAVLSGNTLYIGGTFTRVAPATGHGVPVSVATGSPPAAFAKVAGGAVYAATPDGSGGWYLGGAFTWVGGQPRAGLAHVLADGTTAPWNPGTNGVVVALALSGSTVIAGGQF